MQKSFMFYSDPQHGWLRVPLANLRGVGVSLDMLSHYSYRKGDTIYLEEDCDAGVFIKAYRRINGNSPTFKDSYRNSPSHIRQMARI